MLLVILPVHYNLKKSLENKQQSFKQEPLIATITIEWGHFPCKSTQVTYIVQPSVVGTRAPGTALLCWLIRELFSTSTERTLQWRAHQDAMMMAANKFQVRKWAGKAEEKKLSLLFLLITIISAREKVQDRQVHNVPIDIYWIIQNF